MMIVMAEAALHLDGGLLVSFKAARRRIVSKQAAVSFQDVKSLQDMRAKINNTHLKPTQGRPIRMI